MVHPKDDIVKLLVTHTLHRSQLEVEASAVHKQHCVDCKRYHMSCHPSRKLGQTAKDRQSHIGISRDSSGSLCSLHRNSILGEHTGLDLQREKNISIVATLRQSKKLEIEAQVRISSVIRPDKLWKPVSSV